MQAGAGEHRKLQKSPFHRPGREQAYHQVVQTRVGGWSEGGPRVVRGCTVVREREGWEGGVPRGCRQQQVGAQGQEGGSRVVQGVQSAG